MVVRLTTSSAVSVSIKQRKSVLCSLSPRGNSMTATEMYRLYQEREKVFRSQYMGVRWPEPEPPRMFTFHERQKRRDVMSSSFVDMSYEELIRFAKINHQSWFDEVCSVVNATPAEDAKLTPEDTKELDDFLNSFARKEAS